MKISAYMKRVPFILWMVFECLTMFLGTLVFLSNIHAYVPVLKLREWSIPFLVVLPSVVVLWITIYMQCHEFYKIGKQHTEKSKSGTGDVSGHRSGTGDVSGHRDK